MLLFSSSHFSCPYFTSLIGAVRASARGVQTGGVLSVKLIRLNFKGRVGLFGRKANPYVKATYGSIEKLSPTYVCDNDSPLSDKALVFNVTDVNSLVRLKSEINL